MSPRLVCEAVDTADWGYGPTEEHACTRPATHRARGTDRCYPVRVGGSVGPA